MGNVTSCLAEFCKPQVEACTKDKVCNDGINCVIACPQPATKACVEGCIQKSLDQPMLEIGICADAHHCIPKALVESTAGCDDVPDKPTCEAQGCSWCVAGAVPDSCKTKDEARQLPPAVFQCSGI